MLALALTLAVAAQPPPQPLDSPAQVKELCDALAPADRAAAGGDPVARGRAEEAHEAAREALLERTYSVTIPAERLRFDRYDPAERRLTLSDRSFLTAAGGALHLWAADERGLPVTVEPDVAQRLVAAAAQRTLSLALTFHLPEEDEVACAHPNLGRRYTLGVEPFAWEYAANGEVLARGGAGGDRPTVTAAGGAVPRVEVETPPGQGGEALRGALQARRGDLEACYRRALERDPALDGSLVADVELSSGGVPHGVRVAADSVQDDAMVGCVRDVIARTRFPAARSGRAQLALEFSLQAPTARR